MTTDDISNSGVPVGKPADLNIQLSVDTSSDLQNDVTELVVQYLQALRLEDHVKTKETSFTLWDFAGQHLYYASHSVFLSPRAVYALVYNLTKDLNAPAEPRVKQGIHDIVLENKTVRQIWRVCCRGWLLFTVFAQQLTSQEITSKTKDLTYALQCSSWVQTLTNRSKMSRKWKGVFKEIFQGRFMKST